MPVFEVGKGSREAMKRLMWTGLVGVCALGLVHLGMAEVRLPGDSPYHVIVEHNPFRLRLPPTNVVVVPQPSAPSAQINVNLSGITELGGKRRAWMVIPAGGPRTDTTSFSMAVGDPEFEGVVVERIDLQKGEVQIRMNGVPSTLDFENDGIAYAGPPAAKPATTPDRAGRVPGQPRTAVPVPNPGSRTVGPAESRSASMNLPGRGSSAIAGNTAQVIPSRAIRTAQQDMLEPVDPALQAIQMQVQEMHARQRDKPFPPTPPIPGMNVNPGDTGQ